MLSKILNAAIITFGFLLITIFVLFYIRDATILTTLKKSDIVGSDIRILPPHKIAFTFVDTTDFIAQPYPSKGDIVYKIGDSLATVKLWDKNFKSPKQLNNKQIITFISGHDTLQTTMQTSPIKSSTFLRVLIIFILRFFITLSFFFAGIWAFYHQPHSGVVRAFTLFCFAMAGIVIQMLTTNLNNFAAFSLPYQKIVLRVLSIYSIFFGSFWINLHLLFPQPRNIIKKHPFITYTLCYVPTAIVITLLLSPIKINFNSLLTIVLITQILLGFYYLLSRYLKAKNPIIKRQTRLVLWGSGIGLLGLLLVLMAFLIFNQSINNLPVKYITSIIIILFLGLLLSPLSFIYAFGKYRLMEVEVKVRRATQYIVISVILFILFYFIIYLTSEFFLEILDIKSRTPILILALLISAGFIPTHKKVQTLIEKWIYPERIKLRKLLYNFLARTPLTTDRKSFWIELKNKIEETLKVSFVIPVLQFGRDGSFAVWDGTPTPFKPGSEFIKEIQKMEKRPVLKEELLGSQKVKLTPQEESWLTTNQMAMILPMVTHSKLKGFLGIGFKDKNKEFAPSEFELLQALASQIAITYENIVLIEENYEKKRLESELLLAQKVQKRMLPHKIPKTPGLRVAANSLFCQEVAGDYYDIIQLDNHRTAIAIGDVSGKGAGAALLMSNLQASFRTALKTNLDLAEMMSMMNELIYNNSQPDQFITFFVALYNNENSQLSYVNAGHNPPLLLHHHNGIIEELKEGGVLVGALPEAQYDKGEIVLESDDLLFFYTDGLSEAYNDNNEMFGEQRIKDFLKKETNKTPEIILEEINIEIEKFIGETPLSDDLTLLIAKPQ